MLVPNFNSMVRIDKSLIEAVIGGGATEWRTIRQVTLSLVLIGTSPIALWLLRARQASKGKCLRTARSGHALSPTSRPSALRNLASASAAMPRMISAAGRIR